MVDVVKIYKRNRRVYNKKIKHPTSKDLIDILNKYKIVYREIEIEDKRYVCGYVEPFEGKIVLNKKNYPLSNLETISHELMHIYYEHIKKYNFTEQNIEKFGKQYLKEYRDYRAKIMEKLKLVN